MNEESSCGRSSGGALLGSATKSRVSEPVEVACRR